MKRKTVAFLSALALLLAIPVCAASPRLIRTVPTLSFDDTTANCSARITADNASDSISATMTLRHGTRTVDSWSGSGYGVLNLSGTATVSRWRTYILDVDVTINGVAQPTVSISETNN